MTPTVPLTESVAVKPTKKFNFKPILKFVTPNVNISSTTNLILGVMWIFLMVVVWSTYGAKYLPTPMETLKAFPKLWFEEGLGVHLMTSIMLNLTAVGIMAFVSYIISISTVMPLTRSLANLISLGRFNGFVGMPIIFMSLLHDQHNVKIALLVYGMSVYTILSLTEVFGSIPKDLFDHSRTLRMGEWRVVWEVVVRGTLDKVIEVMRINIAMGWMMLPLVEGRYKSEGGIGALMEIENKHLNLDMVFCALFVILLVGFAQDYVIGLIKSVVCPHAALGKERS